MTIGFVLYLLVFGVLVLVVEPMRAQAADEADRLLEEADEDDDEPCRSRTPTGPGCGCRTR